MNQRIIGWVLAVGIILLVLSCILRGDFMMAGLNAILFFLAPLIARPDLCWILTIISMGSGISLGMIGGANLHLLFMLSFVGLMIIKIAAKGSYISKSSIPRKACVVWLVIIIMTGFCRGWGFKFLDSSMWGGMQYVSLISAILFYLYSVHVTISENKLKKTLTWLFVFSLIPAAGFFLITYVPAMKWVENVVPVADTGLERQAPEVVRWVIMQNPAIWMGVSAIYLYERLPKFTPTVVLVSALSFIMLGLSGHRSVAVLLGLTVCVYLLIKRHEINLFKFMKFAVVLIVLVVIFYLFVGELPRNFQRALSWLPGIDVAYEAEMDASSTSLWRIELWRQLIPMIPDYLWIGRGLAFSQFEAMSASMLASDAGTQHIYFIAVHLYHNGPLLLILDLGLAGFIAGLVFMLSGIRHYGRQLRCIPKGSRWNSTYVVFFCFFVGQCLFFLAVFGAVGTLCTILVLASILEVILHSTGKLDVKPTMDGIRADCNTAVGGGVK